jgi:3-deoxy-manno-octulosonate cytidylyltransferase (CMP-KDO synthetase)
MTSLEHCSGTDRIAEVVAQKGWRDNEIIVNLQGDEPLMEPGLIRQVAQGLDQAIDAKITTVCAPIHTTAELFDPHVVKVIIDKAGYAMMFSRAPVPWDRDAFAVTTEELPDKSEHYRHIGLYAYRAGFLAHYAQMEPCHLEKTESLEQLRAMWHGIKIHVSVSDHLPPPGVDTQKDLEQVEALLRARYTNTSTSGVENS